MKFFKVFDALSTLLFLLCVIMLISGGHLFVFGKTKIEMISLDLWVMVAILFGLIAYKSGKRATTVYRFTFKIFNHLADSPAKSLKYASIFGLVVLVELFFAHWGKHWSFMTSVWDMGFIHPALFQPFAVPVLKCDLCLNNSYLGEHLSFTMFLPALILQYFQSDILIFLMQVIFIGIGSYFLIFKGPLKNKTFLILLAVVALSTSRALRGSLIWDFREDHLAFMFLCLTLYFLYTKRLFLYFVFLITSLLSKEHIGLMTFFLSVPILFEKQFSYSKSTRIRLALATSLISIAYVLVAFKLMIPYFSGGGESHNNIVYLFGEYGKSPSEIMFNVLRSPSAMFDLFGRIFLAPKAVKYLVIILFAPLVLGYKRWWWLFPIMAGLSLNLLPLSDNYKMMIFHYELPVYPYIAMWMVLSLSEIKPKLEMKKLIWISVAFISFSGRWPMHNIRKHFFDYPNEVRVLNELPRDAIVLANENILSHLNHFKGIRPLHRVQGWENFLNQNSNKVDHHRKRIDNFDMIVFDLRKAYEEDLYLSSLKNGWEDRGNFKPPSILRAVFRASDIKDSHSVQ